MAVATIVVLVLARPLFDACAVAGSIASRSRQVTTAVIGAPATGAEAAIGEARCSRARLSAEPVLASAEVMLFAAASSDSMRSELAEAAGAAEQ